MNSRRRSFSLESKRLVFASAHQHYSAQGFTYVMLMIAIAIIGLASAMTVQVESFEHRRIAEQRLLEVGSEYLVAVRRYAQSAPPGAQTYPSRLEDLLKDPRVPSTRRYLRRLYRDPLMNSSEWGLIAGPQGGIAGVYSLAKGTPIKQANFDRPYFRFEGATNYQAWRFAYLPVGTAGAQVINQQGN